jgi:hypothetical protein
MGRRKKNYNPEDAYTPTPEEIGKRAHQKWIDRGCVEGCAQQDWFEAEAELRAEYKPIVVVFKVKPTQEESSVQS